MSDLQNTFLKGRVTCSEPISLSLRQRISNWKKILFATTALGAFASANTASAQSIWTKLSQFDISTPSSVVLFALFGGAISFAMLATFWLIREKSKASKDIIALKRRFAQNKAEKERLEALVNVNDERILIWDQTEANVESFGSMIHEADAPEKTSDFVAFGKWLTPNSTMELESAIKNLQEEGSVFDLIVETANGSFVEANGRTSGSFPFVKFKELDQKRRDVASLSIEHDRLLDKFNLVQTLFQKLPFPIWMRNKDKTLHWVNDAYKDAVDADDNEAATNENKQLFDRAEREKIVTHQENQSVFEGDLPAIVSGDRKKLHTFDVLAEAGSAGIAVDRSDVELARTTLKETINSHEQTIDNLATAIAMFDADKNLSFANSSFLSLWELDRNFIEEVPSNGEILEAMRSSGKLSEIPDWKKWKAQQLETYHSTETRDEQWHLPDGQTLRVIVSPLSQGGTSWAFENVTEELELKSSYNALMRVQGETLDHLNEAVSVFGSDGKIKLTNPTFLNLWKFEEAYALDGKHINDFSEKCASLLLNQEEWEKIKLGVTSVNEVRDDLSGQIELLNGRIFEYRLVQLPAAQTMLTLVDMTASVNVERALKERNDALEESDELKTRFIQHVSYELRAPLTSIAGFAEILNSDIAGKLNDKQLEYLDYISQSSDVLKALIDDILDLATIDAGAMQLDLQKVSVKEVFENAIDAVEDKLDRRKLKVKIALDKGADKIVADPTRLRQIFYNLISNAANASPDGTSISVQSKQEDGFLNIIVADQGSGIPDEQKEKIFERFESGKSNERRKGAGLGLSIVKSFVELHGGEVRVEDADKRGAKFICSLPIEPEAVLAAAE